jgi:anthranilate phosphoribosyltransferase
LNANVKIVEDILAGKLGPKRDIVALNAAYAFYVAGKVRDINEGFAFANDLLDDGQAVVKLDALIKFTNL